jgi:hypothetical protein
MVIVMIVQKLKMSELFTNGKCKRNYSVQCLH